MRIHAWRWGRVLGALGLSLALPFTVYAAEGGAAEAKSAQVQPAAPQPEAAPSPLLGPVKVSNVHVRKEVSKLNRKEVASLRKGVQVMKSRPASDPTSWTYQAAMHGSYTEPPLADWNQCQHGSYFFFAWHRMYLYYFERILRASSGDPQLALPYWNYSQKARSHRQLPLPFRQPAAASNPLYVAERDPNINAGTGVLPLGATSTAAAFATTNFTGAAAVPSFGGQQVPGPFHFDSPHGQLESQPHDIIHVLVGGDTGWMSDPNTAAQDPIFYLHHANIDRLWKRWLDLGGGRANPTGDAVFMTTRFYFYDETGARVSLSGAQILDTVRQLGYRYDDDPVAPSPLVASASRAPLPPGQSVRTAADVTPPPAPAANPEVLGSTAKPPAPGTPASDLQTGPAIPLGTAPVNLSLSLKPQAQARFQELARAPEGKARPILLNVEGIEVDRTPGVYYEIYVDLPQGEKPDFSSPSYVGNLAFFALNHPHGGHAGHPAEGGEKPRVFRTYDITRVVRGIQARHQWSNDVKVTLVMRGVVDEKTEKQMPVSQGTKARIARVDIVGL